MKRFLILSILAAFLAIPAISLADDYGSGTVASATVTASSMHGPQQTSTGQNIYTMQTQNLTFKTGNLAFSETNGATFNKDNGGSQYFRGTVVFAGPAKASDGSQLRNLFVNMSGFTVSAAKTPSAEMGQGAISGSLTHIDSPAKGGQPQTVSFTGSYNMKVQFTGTAPNYTGGTATVTMTIAGLQDPSTGATQPVIVSINMPATHFTVLNSPASAAMSNWSLTDTTTSGPNYDPTNNGGDNTSTAALTLTQYGSDVIGQIENNQVSGTIVGSKFTVTSTKSNTQDNGDGTSTITSKTTTITGTVATGSTFGVPEATMSGTSAETITTVIVDQNGKPISIKTTAGNKGYWTATCNSPA